MKLFNFISRKNSKKDLVNTKTTNGVVAKTPGRISSPGVVDLPLEYNIGSTKFIDWTEIQSFIPTIRRVSYLNGDLGLAVNDMVQLTNTGHKINFDKSIDPDLIDEMRRHLEDKGKQWGDGVAGIQGLVNKLISQIWISGALSAEAPPNNTLTGVDNVVLVNPETIVFGWNVNKQRFEPYQRPQFNFIKPNAVGTPVKLNLNTYRYMGLNGDTEIPYGIPPMLSALNPLAAQNDMLKNIRYIVKQVGLWGFLEVLLAKPTLREGLSESQQKAKLEALLEETKINLLNGMAEGLVVGYEEDHTFEFHSSTKNISGLSDIFNINETQVANGLKTPPSFLGASSGKGTETGITIIFTKMLAQLNNIQAIVSAFLEFIYSLELTLSGYSFKSLKVEFKPSTVTDELKIWQGKEVKQRVLHNLRVDGIIDQQNYADQMGYEAPASDEPVVPFEQQSGNSPDPAAEDQNREKQKDASDRKVREKNKPQPKRKDNKNS